MGRTTIEVNDAQKEALIRFKGFMERKTGEPLTQGEALSIAAEKAIEYIEEPHQ